MSPSSSQAERWLAKAGERSGANHAASHAAPGSVNSRRSGGTDAEGAYARSSVVRESFDSRGDDYASRGGNPRYSNENVEVRPRARRRPRAGEPRAPRASRDDLAEDLFRVLSDTSPVSEASPPLPRGPPSPSARR